MPVTVSAATAADKALVEAFGRMIPQLSSSASKPRADELDQIIDAPATTLLIARDEEGVIMGTLTLVLFRIPTGVRAWIEDVVVDFPRGKSKKAGEALMNEAIRLAQRLGAKTLDLTSAPRREHANAMYQRLGFEIRETNVYRKTLEA